MISLSDSPTQTCIQLWHCGDRGQVCWGQTFTHLLGQEFSRPERLTGGSGGTEALPRACPVRGTAQGVAAGPGGSPEAASRLPGPTLATARLLPREDASAETWAAAARLSLRLPRRSSCTAASLHSPKEPARWPPPSTVSGPSPWGWSGRSEGRAGFSRRARVCSAAVAMKTTLTVIPSSRLAPARL